MERLCTNNKGLLSFLFCSTSRCRAWHNTFSQHPPAYIDHGNQRRGSRQPLRQCLGHVALDTRIFKDSYIVTCSAVSSFLLFLLLSILFSQQLCFRIIVSSRRLLINLCNLAASPHHENAADYCQPRDCICDRHQGRMQRRHDLGDSGSGTKHPART